jgi:hypothetical protein
LLGDIDRAGQGKGGGWKVSLGPFNPGVAVVVLPQHDAASLHEVAEPHPVVLEGVAVEHHDVVEVVALVHVDHVPGGVEQPIQLVRYAPSLISLIGTQRFLNHLDDLAQLRSGELSVGLVLQRIDHQPAYQEGNYDCSYLQYFHQ